MKQKDSSSEERMVSEFIRAEVDSPRFKKRIDRFLRSRSLHRSFLTSPDISSQKENQLRIKILKHARGYPNGRLFEGYPRGIKWKLVEVSALEIRDFMYLNHEEWLQRTDGSRRVRDAIRLLPQNGFVEKGVQGVLKKLSLREPLPHIIVLSSSRRSKKRMILEGHFRATAMGMMRGNRKFTILFGMSSEVKGMKYW